MGKHIGGAARITREKFGAQERVSEGITGQCCAIPTLDENFQRSSTRNLYIPKEFDKWENM